MKQKKAGIDLGLTDQEKATLHAIAKTAIEARCRHAEVPDSIPDSETLKEKRGAFVSLHRHGNLRGCIGYIIAKNPLYLTIREMAQAAAFQDPRFEPLSEQELKDLDIEISVLTPMQQITDIEEIEVGKHGLMIVKGYSTGLLLPQVATEYGWDRKTFLEHTCMKAGLPTDAWKDPGAKIFIFSADVF